MKLQDQNKYHVLGLMSGTSLDGIDMAYCSLWLEQQKWHYEILEARTYPYTVEWKENLGTAHHFSGLELTRLDWDYGRYLGRLVNDFISENGFDPDFIASHGHTIFHQPEEGFTLQIGKGEAIAAETGMTCISDFRSMDVALGGQGAPLVPLGDRLIFPEYDYCLNLGGFANISYEENGQRLAFDVCPVNIIINELVREHLDIDFDKDGAVGKGGTIHPDLLQQLNALDYYTCPAPKSLGREWLHTEFSPVLNAFDIPLENKLKTIYEHIAIQIASSISKNGASVLVTGGGAFNRFLVNLLNEKTERELKIPGSKLVEYKEALIFALLGVLRFREETNCLASVTGARADSSSGTISFP